MKLPAGSDAVCRPHQASGRKDRSGLHWLVMIFLGMVLGLPGAAAGANEGFQPGLKVVLTNAVQVRVLTVEEAKQLLPVRMRGVVTYADPSLDWLFVQDSTGGVFVRSTGLEGKFSPGQEVEVRGNSQPGNYSPFIIGGQFTELGAGSLPTPLASSIAELGNGKTDGVWVEVSGVVGSAMIDHDRLILQVVEGSNWLKVFIRTVPPGWQELVNARVRLRGVCAVTADQRRRLTGIRLFVPEGGHVIVEDPAPKNPFDSPILPIVEALKASSENAQDELIRIRGAVQINGRDGSIQLCDQTGLIRLDLTKTNGLMPGVLLDAVGSKLEAGGESFFRLTDSRRFGIIDTNKAWQAGRESLVGSQVGTNLLTSIQQVRALDSELAAQALPVRVRGVVTYYDSDWATLFVQGTDAGIFVNVGGAALDLTVGDWVDLEGVTAPGDFAPVIAWPRFKLLGRAPLPPARETSLEELVSGLQDSQRVSLEGIVQSARLEWGHAKLKVAGASGILEIVIPELPDEPDIARFVDARVQMMGVCGTIFNQRRQLTGVRLFVPGLEYLEISQGPPKDPFALSTRTIGALMQFTTDAEPDHRVRVEGVVTLHWPGRFTYIQDESGGVMVRGETVESLQPGDRAEAAGFPVIGSYTPILEESVLRRLASGSPPATVIVTAEQVLSAESDSEILDSKLIRIQGRLLDQTALSKEKMLMLQNGTTIFKAHLDGGDGDQFFSALRIGSELEVTGVCSVEIDSEHRPRSFQLFLRSPADIQIRRSAPWWTFRHTAWTLGGSGAVLLAVLGWVGLLRSQVRRQTFQMHQEVEEHKRAKARLEAEVVERKRMELEIEKTHRELLAVSRQAGMAEVATGVLHNVGNVLNSVNVSATLMGDRLRKSKTGGFTKVAGLLKEQAADLPGFFARDARAAQLPGYLEQFAGYLAGEQTALLGEVENLRKNIEHIKEIVAMQQSYAKVSGLTEMIPPAELFEDALRLNANSMDRHAIAVDKDFAELPPLAVDKHKVLQILVNFLRNAKHACDDSGRTDKRITLRLHRRNGCVQFAVTDNGVGIPAENLDRIFNHGFTTRKRGHGFGLHSGANAAREMGGAVTVHSDGPGRGATFTLELPAVIETVSPTAGTLNSHPSRPSPLVV